LQKRVADACRSPGKTWKTRAESAEGDTAALNTRSISSPRLIKIDVVIPDQDLDKVVDLIATAAATGEVGDGKIFVSSLENVIRIRTRESGENAI
jgi:nitrogen regulatory protein PII